MLTAKEDLYNRVFVQIYLKERASFLVGQELIDYQNITEKQGLEAANDFQHQRDAAQAAKEASICAEAAYPVGGSRSG